MVNFGNFARDLGFAIENNATMQLNYAINWTLDIGSWTLNY